MNKPPTNSISSTSQKAKKPAVIRAIRYAFGMVRGGNLGFLIREVLSFVASTLYWPWWRMSWSNNDNKAIVKTDYPVAYESPDHLTPHGTAENNITHYGFIHWAVRRYGKKGSFLDLGCSGGQLVVDFARIGWHSVGLEGSDYSAKHGRACWGKFYNKLLFTCDIGKPFDINQKPFDVITAWQVLEHLDIDAIKGVCQNIESHAHNGTVFIATTSASSETAKGIELHLTRWPAEKWEQFLLEQLPSWKPVTSPSDWLQVRRCNDKGGRAVALQKIATG